MSFHRMRGRRLAFLALTAYPLEAKPDASTSSAPTALFGSVPPATSLGALGAWQSTHEQTNGTVEVRLRARKSWPARVLDASRTRAAHRSLRRRPVIADGTLSLAVGHAKLNTPFTKVG